MTLKKTPKSTNICCQRPVGKKTAASGWAGRSTPIQARTGDGGTRAHRSSMMAHISGTPRTRPCNG
jgi:hypothetical protein